MSRIFIVPLHRFSKLTCMKKSVLIIIISSAMFACVSHVEKADLQTAELTLRTADSLENAPHTYADTSALSVAEQVFRSESNTAKQAKSAYHLGRAYQAAQCDSLAFICFSRAADAFLRLSDSVYYPLSVLEMSLIAERQYKENGNATMLQAIRTLQREMIRKQNSSHLWQSFLGLMIIVLVIAIIGVGYALRKKSTQAVSIQREDLDRNIELLLTQGRITVTLQWDDYKQFCRTVNAYLYNAIDRLSETGLQLSEQDVRFLVLVLLDLSGKEIADIMNLSQNSISNKKTRTAQKLGTIAADLREKLICLILKSTRQ